MKVRRILGSSVTCRLVTAFVTSRLAYCNALLADLPQSTIAPLQRVQKAAVRLVSGLRPRDHMTSSLRELHWLLIRYRIMYKLCLTMHNARRSQSVLHNRHSLADSGHDQPRATLFISEQQVRTARPTSQDRRASVFVLRTRRLPSELTSITDTQTF